MFSDCFSTEENTKHILLEKTNHHHQVEMNPYSSVHTISRNIDLRYWLVKIIHCYCERASKLLFQFALLTARNFGKLHQRDHSGFWYAVFGNNWPK